MDSTVAGVITVELKQRSIRAEMGAISLTTKLRGESPVAVGGGVSSEWSSPASRL